MQKPIVMPPMITVFNDDESFDEKGTRNFVEWLIKQGITGIAVNGSTGEFITMSDAERKKIAEVVIDQVKGRIEVYVGTGHYSTGKVKNLSMHAQKAGADGVMIIPPYYLNPPKSAAMNHFREIRQHIDIPIMLYNNPWFAGYQFNAWEIAELVEEGIIQSVKAAHGDVKDIHNLKKLCGDKLKVLYGHDINIFEALVAGADGLLTGVINLIPSLIRKLCDLVVKEKQYEKAKDFWFEILTLTMFVQERPDSEEYHWLSCFKSGLNIMGINAGKPRKPLLLLSEQKEKELKVILEKLYNREF